MSAPLGRDILRLSLSMLAVGDSFCTVHPTANSTCYNLARKLRIKISVHRVSEGMYAVTRTA